MKTAHTIDQIIDLEFFLHEDSLHPPDDLHQRDRGIALAMPGDRNNTPTNSELVSGWALARRQAEFSQSSLDSPGTIFAKSRSLATTLTGIKGLLAGLLTGFAFFAYVGTTPINVLEFLIIFVLSQLALATLLLFGLLVRKLIPSRTLPSTTFSLLYTLGKRTFRSIHKRWFFELAGEKRESVLHAFGIIQRNHRLYGSLFYWPLFSLTQLFGITFNVGLLASSLLKIVTSDLAFGWQSTLRLSSTVIEQMVQALAIPWSWFLPEGMGVPTLQQIEGSHIILKDGIYHLSTTDLVAWWPFLILCLVVYGLTARTLFFITSRIMEGRTLRGIQFSSPQCQALIRRMRSPVVSTQAKPEEETDPKPRPPESPIITNAIDEEIIPQIVIVPDEVVEDLKENSLQDVLVSRGFTIKSQHRFMIGYEEDIELLSTLKELDWSGNTAIYIVMESWMVPLVDFISFLKELRSLSTPETHIEIGLTDKLEDGGFSKVRQADMDIWRKKIISIGDPFIELTPIRGICQ